MSSNTPDIDTSNESGKDFGILNSLGIQISFGIACSLMLIVFIICFQFGMDYNLVREEMDARGRRLREERLAEAHSHHPEKRKLVIERKIARKKCSAQNIICTKKDESVDTGSTRSLDCCSSSSNASAGVVDAVREEDHHDEDQTTHVRRGAKQQLTMLREKEDESEDRQQQTHDLVTEKSESRRRCGEVEPFRPLLIEE